MKQFSAIATHNFIILSFLNDIILSFYIQTSTCTYCWDFYQKLLAFPTRNDSPKRPSGAPLHTSSKLYRWFSTPPTQQNVQRTFTVRKTYIVR